MTNNHPDQIDDILSDFSQYVIDEYKKHEAGSSWKDYIDVFESSKAQAHAAMKMLVLKERITELQSLSTPLLL